MSKSAVLRWSACACLSLGTSGWAAEVRCPATIQVKQSLSTPQPGWKDSLSGVPIQVAGVTFFDGPPEEQASLAPDHELRTPPKVIATWKFGQPSTIWISCSYSESKIVLSKALPKTTSECRVTYSSRQSVAGLPVIERIECK